MSVTSPPITKLGRRPAAAITSIIIDDVVVLPCVPATPTARVIAQIEASMPARCKVTIPFSREATSSIFRSGIAVEYVTASQPST
ncbi:unannotated protein [freshwater metagenome]|uniref:Unannotated protein n=1 Tax=freshwater metagenome TaxID=449393 RepID=A0A6J7DLZ4_9ZZZZ